MTILLENIIDYYVHEIGLKTGIDEDLAVAALEDALQRDINASKNLLKLAM